MNLKLTYNIIAKDYYRAVSQKTQWRQTQTAIALFEQLHKRARVLDIGCGPGIQAREFMKRGHHVVGIDFSEEMVRLAKKKAPNAEFRVMDIRKLHFPSNMFDCVFANASLLHIPKKNINAVLAMIWKILKPEGLFYVSLKKGRGEIFLQEDFYGVEGLTRFFSLYGKLEAKEILMKAGFNILVSSINQGRTHQWINFLARKEA